MTSTANSVSCTAVSSSSDLQDIVASSIKEYFTPKYPVYKIQYTHIKITIDDDDEEGVYIDIRVKERIVEVVPKFTSNSRLRQEITQEEYDNQLKTCNSQNDYRNFYKIYCRQQVRTSVTISTPELKSFCLYLSTRF